MLHSLGRVHMDLEPRNVTLIEDSTPILIDFGNRKSKCETYKFWDNPKWINGIQIQISHYSPRSAKPLYQESSSKRLEFII